MATTLDVSYPTETYWETCEKSGYTWKTPKKPYAYFEFCVYGSNHCLIFFPKVAFYFFYYDTWNHELKTFIEVCFLKHPNKWIYDATGCNLLTASIFESLEGSFCDWLGMREWDRIRLERDPLHASILIMLLLLYAFYTRFMVESSYLSWGRVVSEQLWVVFWLACYF